jgi:hypothetical protein
MLAYTPPTTTLQQLLIKYHLPPKTDRNQQVQKVLQRLKVCRTAALGYHVYRCEQEQCGNLKYQYHSCRDRHCPQCGAFKKDAWIEARMQELMPVKYYHMVFTLPQELNAIVMGNRKVLYQLLFDASAATLRQFASDEQYLGAVPGILSVLHTWGQQLSFHPHIHCIVSGGGINNDNTWKQPKRKNDRFLFPVKAMSIVYQNKFLTALQRLIVNGTVIPPKDIDTKQLLLSLYQKQWIVYAKAPFGGPACVVEYLGRYCHKVAISNHRICYINEQDATVTFKYKDYADAGNQKEMTLTATEFIRRFEHHILPPRFTKIRTYGYLSNRNRHQRINEVLKKMKLPLHKGLIKIPIELRLMEKYGINTQICPCCQQSSLKLIRIFCPWKQNDDG